QKQGYAGKLSRVKEFLQPWRSQGPNSTRRSRKLPGLRLVAFWLAKPAIERQPPEQQWVEAITKDQPQIATAENLAQEFRDIVKNRKAGDLEAWLKSAETSLIPRAQWLRSRNTAGSCCRHRRHREILEQRTGRRASPPSQTIEAPNVWTVRL